MSGYTIVPYVIAFANEIVEAPLWFEEYRDEVRLSYVKPRLNDWVNGILRARVKDLRLRPDKRGSERMRKLNTRRQWRCMDKLLCQVCAEPATGRATGRIPWLLTKTVFEETGPDSGRTNAPPCCWSCVPKALEQCQMLQDDNFLLCTVAGVTSAGVLADTYKPLGLPYPYAGPILNPVLAEHNVFVAWDAHRYHATALAVAQVVELHDIRPVTPP